MHPLRMYPRARMRRHLWAKCLPLMVLIAVDNSASFATSLNLNSIFGSSSSVSIRVVDSAGPIDVTYDFTGTASNGLPTIEIYEKLFQPTPGGTETVLWSDVQIEICVNKGGDGSVVDGINDAIDHINDIIDNFFGFLNNNNTNNNYNSNQYGEPENGEGWENGIDIGIDKFVKNKAGVLFPNYRIVLGTGLGDSFMPSTPGDDLYILSSPMPKEVTYYFENPPGAGADYLQWTSDGVNKPGLNNQQEATFWFGVHVPQSLFTQSTQDGDVWKARFTIRQHAEIPEPTSLVLLGLGVLATSFTCRSRRERTDHGS